MNVIHYKFKHRRRPERLAFAARALSKAEICALILARHPGQHRFEAEYACDPVPANARVVVRRLPPLKQHLDRD
jgi:hypothetical protein